MTDALRLEDRGYGYIAKILDWCKNAIADYVIKRCNYGEKKATSAEKIISMRRTNNTENNI